MRGYLTHDAIGWFASRHLEPWDQLARRAGDWVWKHDLETMLGHARESTKVTAERETTCVLIETVNGAGS